MLQLLKINKRPKKQSKTQLQKHVYSMKDFYIVVGICYRYRTNLYLGL